MSKLRSYRCSSFRTRVHINDLIAVMRELGLSPQLHHETQEITSHGTTMKTNLTWNASILGGTFSREGGVVYKLDKNGYLVGSPSFFCDDWGVSKKHKRLVHTITAALNQSAKEVVVPIAAGLTVQEVQMLGRYLGGQLSGKQLQIAPRPIVIRIPTGLKDKPYLVREVQPVVQIRTASNGAVTLVMPDRVLREFRPAVENLRRLGIGLVTVKTQAAMAARDERVVQPVVFVDSRRIVNQVDVDWVRDDDAQNQASPPRLALLEGLAKLEAVREIGEALEAGSHHEVAGKEQEKERAQGDLKRVKSAIEVAIADERALGLAERLHMDPSRAHDYAAQLANQAKQQNAAVFVMAA